MIVNSEDVSLPESKLVLQEGPLPETPFELGRTDVVIGRSPNVDFVIGFAAVSGNHALISVEGDQYVIEDLNSSNGTFVNGERLLERRLLQNGDEIRLGQTIVLTFVSQPIDETMLQAPSCSLTKQMTFCQVNGAFLTTLR